MIYLCYLFILAEIDNTTTQRVVNTENPTTEINILTHAHVSQGVDSTEEDKVLLRDALRIQQTAEKKHVNTNVALNTISAYDKTYYPRLISCYQDQNGHIWGIAVEQSFPCIYIYTPQYFTDQSQIQKQADVVNQYFLSLISRFIYECKKSASTVVIPTAIAPSPAAYVAPNLPTSILAAPQPQAPLSALPSQPIPIKSIGNAAPTLQPQTATTGNHPALPPPHPAAQGPIAPITITGSNALPTPTSQVVQQQVPQHIPQLPGITTPVVLTPQQPVTNAYPQAQAFMQLAINNGNNVPAQQQVQAPSPPMPTQVVTNNGTPPQAHPLSPNDSSTPRRRAVENGETPQAEPSTEPRRSRISDVSVSPETPNDKLGQQFSTKGNHKLGRMHYLYNYLRHYGTPERSVKKNSEEEQIIPTIYTTTTPSEMPSSKPYYQFSWRWYIISVVALLATVKLYNSLSAKNDCLFQRFLRYCKGKTQTVLSQNFPSFVATN